MPPLNSSSNVAQWVCEHPQTARVFEDLHIDYCCGGNVPLAQVCEQAQLDTDSIVSRLTQVIEQQQVDPSEDWRTVQLAELCDHIQQTHHAYLREELPRLSGLIDKVCEAHGERYAELSELRDVFAVLRAELEPHMFKEEQILFPAIRRIEHDASQPDFPFGTVANPIRMMEHEHDVAGSALAKIRNLTTEYLAPEDACNTYRVMLESLRALELDMLQHIHKENNILFPAARELEASRSNP